MEFNIRWLSDQTLRVMKLTIVFLTAFFVTVSAKGVSQSVTFSGKNIPLETVFSSVEKQTGFSFLYNADVLKDTKPVSIDVKSLSLDSFLKNILKDQPVTFSIHNKTILLYRATPAVVVSSDQQHKANGTFDLFKDSLIDVKGRVMNEQGEPLAGANVTVKRTGRGTMTDSKGDFILRNISTGDILVISFIGYSQQDFTIKNTVSFINIILNVAKNELDKVVVQAYGTTTQRYATGNIAKVTAEEIERQPVMNPLEALQGKVAGLDVTQTSGYASAPIKVEIRGRSSINTINNY